MIRFSWSAFAVLLLAAPPAHGWQQQFTQALKNGGAYVETETGEVLFDHRSQEKFVPASTIKVATSLCALKLLGDNFHFVTDFYVTKDNLLAIKGYGDPFLVSEELDLIAQKLAVIGLKEISGIQLDMSYVESNVTIDGVANSANPYDALNGALVANFNTVYFHKSPNGHIQSAEPQTPLTPIARIETKRHPAGKHRVNLGKDYKKGGRYFAELLTEFLKRYDIAVHGDISFGPVPDKSKPFYQHQSSKPLPEVIRGLLEFSTNFMANQLFLVMGAHRYGPPATAEKGQRALVECLGQEIGWKDFQLTEGAGLSRKNRVTARQMMQLLRQFQPYRELLPTESGVFQAKTGTLHGVNTYAGYFPHDNGQTIRFVILVNYQVPYNYKFKLAKMLYTGINGHAPPER